jgi:hypothetical protein
MATTRQRGITREDLIERLQAVAAKLGKDTVSRIEFQRESGIREYHVLKYFDGWNDFVRAAGLEPNTSNQRLTDDELFEALRDAYIEAGGIIPRTPLRRLLRHGESGYTKRFGRWQNVHAQFRVWLAEHDPDFPYLDELLPETPAGQARARKKSSGQTAWKPTGRTKYGPFLNFRGLQHAPINEQGVVFLFGMVAFDLGYVVEGVGVGFPDCEAKRCVDRSGDVWERVRIEFEYRSRNFLDHAHRVEDCDVLVCWEHNWPGCAIEVLELRSAIETLGE